MPPQDSLSMQFRNRLLTLSQTPLTYENPGLLDEALAHIPLEQIYQEAEDESNILLAQARSINEEPKYDNQDCVIKALQR